MLVVRPKVAELVFQLYGRSLHPELVEVFQTRTIERGGFSAKIDITTAGHVITWRYDGLTLTEVAAGAYQPLPQRRRLMSHRICSDRTDSVRCRGGVEYNVAFGLESIPAEVFWTFQRELVDNGARKGLLHTFAPSGRMSLGALSYIHVETRQRSLLVQAFHTFPDDHAIVKSTSKFKLP